MSTAQPDRAEDPRETPAISCEEAQRSLAVFASSRLKDDEHARLRSHLMQCAPCREDYRMAVRSLAEVGRAVRERRLAPSPQRRERPERERTERARAAIARAAGARRRGSRFGLRLFLATAALIFLFTVLVPRSEKPLEARWTAGEVRAADALLGPGRLEQAVATGDWCFTRSGGGATLSGAGMTAVLAADTVVLVEDPDGPRVRLQRGALEVDGEAVVTSPSAAVQIDGRARVEIDRGILRAHCIAGTSIVFDAAGELVLAAGESSTADARTGRLVRN